MLLRYLTTALLIMGTAAVTYALTRAPEAVEADVVERELTQISSRIRALRKDIEAPAGHSTPDAAFPQAASPETSATAEYFLQQSERLQRELMDLVLALNALDESPASIGTTSRARSSISIDERIINEPVTYTLQAPKVRDTVALEITNFGSEVVKNPRVTRNGRKRWFSAEAMLDSIVSDGMAERDKALAIWSFLKDNRYHDAPAHTDIELHDPVRYLNVYGYGFCDDSATVFHALAEMAGLRARVWGLGGHVVPEVFFDGAWHMLDPDGEVYYLENDGHTIASVATLQAQPELVQRTPSPIYGSNPGRLANIYATTANNQVSDWYRRTSETSHQIGVQLRPDESIYRSRSNWGLYFSSLYLSEPKSYGNGRFVYEPSWNDDRYAVGNSVSGLAVNGEGGIQWLAPLGETPGTWVIPVASPYPLLSGKLILNANVQPDEINPEQDGTEGIKVDILIDDGTWQRVAHVFEAGMSTLTRSLRPYLPNGHGRPAYRYMLRLTMAAGTRITSLRLESDFQHAPQALPNLQLGANRIHYTDDSQQRQVRVRFEYTEDRG